MPPTLLLAALVTAMLLPVPAFSGDAPPPPPGFARTVLEGGPGPVHDGDTFDADLDGDGTLEPPRERVRLLYVDTPELGESWKGQDVAHGEPAKAFLAAMLGRRPLVLDVPRAEPTGKYGRTLAVVHAGGEPVNLALLRAGHSPFDTRFQFPPGEAAYRAYVAAEADAFAARRGIWGDPASRQRYLERLQREGRTPAAADNPRYEPAPQDARTFRPAALLGRYVRLTGTLGEVRTLGKGVRLLPLERGPKQAPFPVVAFRHIAERLHVDAWPSGTRVRVEGFVKTYKGRPELVLHYGVLER